MKRATGISLLSLWSAAITAVLTYNLCTDIYLFKLAGATNFGIGVTKKLVILSSSVPIEIAATLSLLRFGLIAEIGVYVVSAIGFGFVALGLWRLRKQARVLGIIFFMFEAFILVGFLGHVIYSGPYYSPEFRTIALVSAVLSLILHGWAVFYLFRSEVKQCFV